MCDCRHGEVGLEVISVSFDGSVLLKCCEAGRYKDLGLLQLASSQSIGWAYIVLRALSMSMGMSRRDRRMLMRHDLLIGGNMLVGRGGHRARRNCLIRKNSDPDRSE